MSAHFAEERAQRRVHRVFADVVAQRVERERAFLIVDVRLVLDVEQRHFLLSLRAATAQISVELTPQEFLRGLAAEPLLHDRQRRILGESFGEHRRALTVAADDLMRPPLVRELVGRHEVREVDLVVAFFLSIDEADAFGVRDRVRECLRESLRSAGTR